MGDHQFPDMEAILNEMRGRFFETAQEKIDLLYELLGTFSVDTALSSHGVEDFRREVHSLKGMGGTFQMPMVTTICHQMEGYFSHVDGFSDGVLSDLHLYTDRLNNLIESSGDYENPAWGENLPSSPVENCEGEVISRALVLLNPSDLRNEAIELLKQSGFEVVLVEKTSEAFGLAIEKKPTMVIVEQKLAGFDGAELLRGLGATKTLMGASFAMVCPDRRQALDEKLTGVQLLSKANLDRDILNFIALAVTV